MPVNTRSPEKEGIVSSTHQSGSGSGHHPSRPPDRTYLSQPKPQWPTKLCLGRFWQCYSTWVPRGKKASVVMTIFLYSQWESVMFWFCTWAFVTMTPCVIPVVSLIQAVAERWTVIGVISNESGVQLEVAGAVCLQLVITIIVISFSEGWWYLISRKWNEQGGWSRH